MNDSKSRTFARELSKKLQPFKANPKWLEQSSSGDLFRQSSVATATDDILNEFDDSAYMQLAKLPIEGSIQAVAPKDQDENQSLIRTDLAGSTATHRYESTNPMVNQFVAARRLNYQNGLPSPKWDDFSKNYRGTAMTMVQGLISKAVTGFEGIMGGMASGILETEKAVGDDEFEWKDYVPNSTLFPKGDKYSPSGNYLASSEKGQQEIALAKSDPNLASQFEQNRIELRTIAGQQAGNAAKQNARSVTNFLTFGFAADLAGPDPTNPSLINERLGRGSSPALVKTAEMLGSAIGTLPVVVPGMLLGRADLAVASTIPFYWSGYNQSWDNRYNVWKQQQQFAEENGIDMPLPPSMSDMEAAATMQGLIEVGSEGTGNLLTLGILKAPSVGNFVRSKLGMTPKIKPAIIEPTLSELERQFARPRGWKKAVNTAEKIVVAGLIEGPLEEGVPQAGQVILDKFYTPREYQSSFFTAETAEQMVVGAMAGGMFAGYSEASTGLKARSAEAKLADAIEKNDMTSIVSGELIKAQQEAKIEMLSPKAPVGKEGKTRFSISTNATSARGSSMAMAQLDDIAAGKRSALFVEPNDVAETLTTGVKARMDALQMTLNPIAMVGGKLVFTSKAKVQEVLGMIQNDDAEGLTGHPVMWTQNSGLAVGAFVFRDAKGDIADVVVYSDSEQAKTQVSMMEHRAGLSGQTVSAVEGEELASISSTVQKQVNMDSLANGMPTQARRGPSKKQKIRGRISVTMAVEDDAALSKQSKVDDQGYVHEHDPEAPFSSPYLSVQEIGGAKNRDVTVKANILEVPDAKLSEGERKLKAAVTSPIILEGDVTFTIKNKDGSKRVITKTTRQNGMFSEQATPDGLFLFRDKGTAFTARNAWAIALHEITHGIGRSTKAGAEFISKLVHLDPVFAMSGGARYMSTLGGDPRTRGMSEPQVISYYAGLWRAATAILADEKSTRVQKEDAREGLARVRSFAEESTATVHDVPSDNVTARAIEWETSTKNSHNRSWKNFADWLSAVLVNHNYSGKEAKQAVFTIKQIMEGASASEMKVHSDFSKKVESNYLNSMARYGRAVTAAGGPEAKPAAATAQTSNAAAPLPSLRPTATEGVGTFINAEADQSKRSAPKSDAMSSLKPRGRGPIEDAKAEVARLGRESISDSNTFFKQRWATLLAGTGKQLALDPKNFNRAAKLAIKDIAVFLRDNPKFSDYYRKDWEVSRSILSDYIQRPITDDEMLFFRVFAGLNSPNTKLPSNMGDAVNFLLHWIKAGSFSQIRLGPKPGTGTIIVEKSPFPISGTTANIKSRSVKSVEKLVRELGSVKAAVEHLQEEVPVKELHAFKKSMGYKGGVGGIGNIKTLVMEATGQDTNIPRMFIFGQKVGAYTLNAVGDGRYTTIDIWESRFIRSYFEKMFETNTGLPVGMAEHDVFTEFNKVFKQEFEKASGTVLEASALQAIRWFYIIDSAMKAGYNKATTNETISFYTERALKRKHGYVPSKSDNGGGRQSDADRAAAGVSPKPQYALGKRAPEYGGNLARLRNKVWKRGTLASLRETLDDPSSGLTPTQVTFFSALGRGIDSISTKDDFKATPDKWRKHINKMVKDGKIKQTEVEWSGILDYIKMVEDEAPELDPDPMIGDDPKYVPQVTKGRILLVLEQSAVAKILVLRQGYVPPETTSEQTDPSSPQYQFTNLGGRGNYGPTSRYAGLSTPNTEDYVEEILKFQDVDSPYTDKFTWTSPHWPIQGVIAHVRRVMRMIGAIKEMLVDEAQSDQGQAVIEKVDGVPRGMLDRVNTFPEREEALSRVAMYARDDAAEWADRAVLNEANEGYNYTADRLLQAYYSPNWLRDHYSANQGLPNYSWLESEQRKDIKEEFFEGYIAPLTVEDPENPGVMTSNEALYERQFKALREEGKANENKLPAAPFFEDTSTWLNLLIRHTIMRAVNEGFDQIAIIDGEAAVQRYRDAITQEVGLVVIRPNAEFNGFYDFEVYSEVADRTPISTKSKVKETDIATYFGEDAAKQLVEAANKFKAPVEDPQINEEELTVGQRFQRDRKRRGAQVKGADIRFGGHGMRVFYDQHYPAALAKQIRMLGGTGIEIRIEELTQEQKDLNEAISQDGPMPRVERGNPFVQDSDYWVNSTNLTEDGLVLGVNKRLAIGGIRSAGLANRNYAQVNYDPLSAVRTAIKDGKRVILAVSTEQRESPWSTQNRWSNNNHSTVICSTEAQLDALITALAEQSASSRPYGPLQPLYDPLEDPERAPIFTHLPIVAWARLDQQGWGKPHKNTPVKFVKVNDAVRKNVRRLGGLSMFSMRIGPAGFRDAAVQQIFDKFDPLLQYARTAAPRHPGGNLPDTHNPYLGARLLDSRNGGMMLAARRRNSALLRSMANNGIELEVMDQFLLAQHAESRNAVIAARHPGDPAWADGGSGMTNQDAADLLNDAAMTGALPQLQAHADQWRAILTEAMDNRQAEGLITGDYRRRLDAMWKNYVPLRGQPVEPFDELFENYDNMIGKSLSTESLGLPSATGRRSVAEGITSQIAFVEEDTIRRINRNQIGRAFLNLVLDTNDIGMAQVITPNPTVTRLVNGVARVMHDNRWMLEDRNFGLYTNQDMTINGHDYQIGDQIVIQINNPRLLTALKQPGVDIGWFGRAIQTVGNAWRFMTTGMGNPAFAPLNTIKDISMGAITNYSQRGARDTLGMLGNYAGSFANVWLDNYLNRGPTGHNADWVAAGGDQIRSSKQNLQEKSEEFDRLYEIAARRDPNAQTLLRMVGGWYPAFFEASEKATRLATFRQRIEAGDTAPQAALASRDVTVDFEKGGIVKPILNNSYMFMNAGLQGTANVRRAVFETLTLAPTLFAFGFIMSTLARFMSGRDEEKDQWNYDSLSDYEKSAFMHFYSPSGSGRYIALPMAYGYNVFTSAGARVSDVVFGRGKAGDLASGMISDAMNSFLPFGGSGIREGVTPFANSMAPTMVRPVMELANNTDWQNKPIYPKGMGNTGPNAYKAWDETPEVYMDIADWANRISGGDKFKSGTFDFSPNQLQYLVGYYFSGTGRIVDKMVGMYQKETPIEPRDIPIVRSFVGNHNNDNRRLSQQYYEISKETDAEMLRLRVLKSKETTAAEKLEAKSGQNMGMAKLGVEIGKIDKILKNMKEIKSSPNATPAQLYAIEQARTRLMNRAIKMKNQLTDEENGIR